MAGAKCGRPLRPPRSGTCSHPAGWQTEHPGIGACKFHGGTSPTHNAAAAKQRAGQVAATYGLARDISPGEAILEEVRWSAGHVAWLREQVQALEVGALVWGDAEKITREFADQGRPGADAVLEVVQRAGVNVWLQVYQAERKHLLEASRIALGAGVDARLLQLEELKAGAYVRAIDMLLDRLELTPEQRSRAALELPAVLMLAAEQYDVGDALG